MNRGCRGCVLYLADGPLELDELPNDVEEAQKEKGYDEVVGHRGVDLVSASMSRLCAGLLSDGEGERYRTNQPAVAIWENSRMLLRRGLLLRSAAIMGTQYRRIASTTAAQVPTAGMQHVEGLPCAYVHMANPRQHTLGMHRRPESIDLP